MKLKQTATLLLILLSLPFSAKAQTKQELNDQLFEAVRAGDAAKVTALLDKGADVNAKFRYGTTALFKAAERGHLEVAKVLLARGVDATVKDTFYGSNALSWALQNDHNDVAAAILTKDPASVDDVLMTGARSGSAQLVQVALTQGGAKPETLSMALALTMDNKDKVAIADALKKAGAIPPPTIDAAVLQTYVGEYKSERGTVIAVTVKDGKLMAQVTGQPQITLAAVDKTTFKAIEFDGLAFTMNSEADKVVSFTLKQGPNSTVYKRVQ
jgi:hypothetical protein